MKFWGPRVLGGSKSLSVYALRLIGGLNLNASGSASFSKMCLGIMKTAPQRTVKKAWKRELGSFRLKTTVYLSGISILSILPVNVPEELNPGVFIWTSTV